MPNIRKEWVVEYRDLLPLSAADPKYAKRYSWTYDYQTISLYRGRGENTIYRNMSAGMFVPGDIISLGCYICAHGTDPFHWDIIQAAMWLGDYECEYNELEDGNLISVFQFLCRRGTPGVREELATALTRRDDYATKGERKDLD